MLEDVSPGLLAKFQALVREEQQQKTAAKQITVRELWERWAAAVLIPGVTSAGEISNCRAHGRYICDQTYTRITKSRRPGHPPIVSTVTVAGMQFEHEGRVLTLGDLPWSELNLAVHASWLRALQQHRGFRPSRTEPISPGYQDRILGTLQAQMSYHMGDERLSRPAIIDRNPAHGWPLQDNPEASQRTGFWETWEDIQAFKACCRADLADIFLIAIMCGFRRDEIRLLKKNEVLWEAKQVQLRGVDRKTRKSRTKTRKGRVVVLPSGAFDVLAARRALAPGLFLFPNPQDPTGNSPIPRTTLNNWFRDAREEYARRTGRPATLGEDENMTLHHARHTSAVRLIIAGAPVNWVMDHHGWSSDRMYRRYTRLAGTAFDAMREFMEGGKAAPKAAWAAADAGLFACPVCEGLHKTKERANECEASHSKRGRGSARRFEGRARV